MKINSTIFEKNKGLNGGAIYLNKLLHNSLNKLNNSIDIENTQFIYNSADYFGGAIYSDFEGLNLSYIDKIYFKFNYAYAGGAIYTNNNRNNNLFNVKSPNMYFINNTSVSHGPDFATGPYIVNQTLQYISKNEVSITSGKSFPLQFKLLDEYEQIIYDTSKYYSNIFLKLTCKDDTKIIGNSCYFTRGINI